MAYDATTASCFCNANARAPVVFSYKPYVSYFVALVMASLVSSRMPSHQCVFSQRRRNNLYSRQYRRGETRMPPSPPDTAAMMRKTTIKQSTRTDNVMFTIDVRHDAPSVLRCRHNNRNGQANNINACYRRRCWRHSSTIKHRGSMTSPWRD